MADIQWPGTPDVVWPGTPEEDKNVTASGLAKATGSGLLHEGVTGLLGLPGDANALGNKAVSSAMSWGAKKLGLPEPTAEQQGYLEKIQKFSPFGGMAPTSEKLKAGLENLIPEYKPKNVPEQYAKTIGGFLSLAAATPEILAAKGALAVAKALPTAVTRYGLVPGAASEAAGQATAGGPWEAPARAGVALTTPAIARRLITPNPIRPDQLEMINALKKQGVDSITPAQATGNVDKIAKEADYAAASMSGTSPAKLNTEANRQVTAAALKHAGFEGDSTLPKNINAMVAQNSQEFNRLTNSYQVPLSMNLQTRFRQAVNNYQRNNIAVSDIPAKLASEIDTLANQGSQGGFLTGTQYQNIRSKLGKLSVATDDPQAGRALSDMRHALDDEMRNAISFSNPRDVGAFDAVRDRYHNQLIVEKAAAAKGPEAAAGILTPARLSSAIRSVDGEQELARQTRPITQLARAGEAVLRPLPEGKGASEFRKELALFGFLGGAGAEETGARLVGGNSGDDNDGGAMGTVRKWIGPLAAGAVTGYAASKTPGLYGRMLFSPVTGPTVQKYLTNQAIPSGPMNPDIAQKLLMIRALRDGAGKGETPPSMP